MPPVCSRTWMTSASQSTASIPLDWARSRHIGAEAYRPVLDALHKTQHSAASRLSCVAMAYSKAAEELRRCRAKRADGAPCKAWAIWGRPDGLCSTHAGRTSGPGNGRRCFPHEHAQYHVCRCGAYAWPHRPGGGWCRWPDPPRYESPTEPGTHSWPRLRRPPGFSPQGSHEFRPTAEMDSAAAGKRLRDELRAALMDPGGGSLLTHLTALADEEEEGWPHEDQDE
jgi:hypothetical protein